MSKKKKQPNSPSWFLVILMLSIFWPVGLVFLWTKLNHLSAPQPGKERGHKLRTGGIFLAVLSLFMRMIGGISTGWMLFWLAGAAALYGFDQYQSNRERRFGRYKAVIGDNPTMEISAIASAVGVGYEVACNELQHMLDEHYLSKQAYLDLGAGLFIAHSKYAPTEKKSASKSHQAAPKVQVITPKMKVTASKVQAAASKMSSNAAKSAPSPAKNIEDENEYVRWLSQLRRVNEIIQNEKLSNQIDQIEQYTANIFECVVVHPEKKREINTFMNYYLPTTLKLLDAYGRLEKQNVAGGNIETSKKNIESMVEQLVWAFQRQNDQMFSKEALDISSDIKVMETMLAKDGLSDGGLPSSPFAAAIARKSH